MNKNVTKRYMWIARDKTGLLFFHKYKPKKGAYDWYSNNPTSMQTPTSWFPEVKWEDKEPTKIEVNLFTISDEQGHCVLPSVVTERQMLYFPVGLPAGEVNL